MASGNAVGIDELNLGGAESAADARSWGGSAYGSHNSNIFAPWKTVEESKLSYVVTLALMIWGIIFLIRVGAKK